MRVLVTAASKHGSTAEMAEVIAQVLMEHGVDATAMPVAEVTAVTDYDAVVLGSAVYGGRWFAAGRDFVQQWTEALAARPVWLFSSGPIGDPPRPDEDPVDVTAIVEAIGAREHRIFAGRLDRSRLSYAERAIVIAFRAPYGDFRNWPEIRAWAAGIAEAVASA
ncbi:MAG: flavodoxin domain-containing protein [Micromonosporaceae bacterium]